MTSTLVGDKVWWFTNSYKMKIQQSTVVKTTPKGCWLADFPRHPGTKVNRETSVWRTNRRISSTKIKAKILGAERIRKSKIFKRKSRYAKT